MQTQDNPILVQSYVFKMLSGAFSYPQTDFQELIQDNTWNMLVEELYRYGLLSQSDKDRTSTDKSFFIHDAFWDQPIEQIRSLYTQVFDIGFPSPECPPYAGLYLPNGQTYPGPRTRLLADLNKKYIRWDLSVEDELPDHLAVELEFIHFLFVLTEEARVGADSLDAQEINDEKTWMLNHLRLWIPKFHDHLVTCCPSLFWIKAAQLLRDLIK